MKSTSYFEEFFINIFDVSGVYHSSVWKVKSIKPENRNRNKVVSIFFLCHWYHDMDLALLRPNFAHFGVILSFFKLINWSRTSVFCSKYNLFPREGHGVQLFTIYMSIL